MNKGGCFFCLLSFLDFLVFLVFLDALDILVLVFLDSLDLLVPLGSAERWWGEGHDAQDGGYLLDGLPISHSGHPAKRLFGHLLRVDEP